MYTLQTELSLFGERFSRFFVDSLPAKVVRADLEERGQPGGIHGIHGTLTTVR